MRLLPILGLVAIILALTWTVTRWRPKARGLAVAHVNGQQQAETVTLNSMGVTYARHGQYDKALACFQKTLAGAQSLGDTVTEEHAICNIGSVYESLAQYANAVAYDQKALAESEVIRDKSTEVVVLANLGIVYADLAQYDKALAYDQKSVTEAKATGNTSSEEQTLNNIGNVYEDLAQYDGALKYFQKSLAEAQAIGDRPSQEHALNNIGIVYEDLARYNKALAYFQKSLAEAQSIGDKLSEQTIGNIGNVYEAEAEYDNALAFYQKTLAQAQAIGNKKGEERALGSIGNLYVDLGQHDKAVDYYQNALADARAIGDVDNSALLQSHLMHIYRTELHNPLLAIFYGKQAVNAYQAIRGNIAGMDSETRKKYLESHVKTYRDLAGLLIAQGRLPEAQQVLDLLKDEEYNDYLRRSGAAVSVSPSPLAGRVGLGSGVSYTGLEQKYADLLSQDFNSLAAAGKTADDLQKQKNQGQPADWTPSQQAALDAANADVEAANALYRKTISDLNAAFAGSPSEGVIDVRGCRQFQDTLGKLDKDQPGTVAIYTLVTDTTLYEMLVTPKLVVSAQSAISSSTLNAMIDEFRRELQDPTVDPRPLGKKLYDLILGPIAANLDSYHATMLMWSLDGTLRYLPIAALWDGSSYVAERYATSEFTPASHDSLDTTPLTHWMALAVGVSRAHDVKDDATGTVIHFPALTSVPVELHSVVRSGADKGVLPGTILLDDDFNLSTFSDALARNDADSPAFPVVHIASHFELDPANGDDSGLLLGDGTTLKVSDLDTMPNDFKNTDLVTLSACDTAVASSSTNGAEVDGFATMAQNRGAKSVIATLWAVYDPSTCAFMRRFYSLHARGLTKAEALRQAQLALLRGAVDALAPGAHRQVDRPDADELPTTSKPDAPAFPVDPKAPYAHPYYWAPFMLMGNWR
ncbi:MAG: CHAT domain-containing protein [Capsulimonadaceae bacterium]